MGEFSGEMPSQMEHPDLTPGFTLTVRTLQCGHSFWGMMTVYVTWKHMWEWMDEYYFSQTWHNEYVSSKCLSNIYIYMSVANVFRIYIYIYIYTYIYICVYSQCNNYICIYIHTYLPTYIHTCISFTDVRVCMSCHMCSPISATLLTGVMITTWLLRPKVQPTQHGHTVPSEKIIDHPH